MLKRISIGIAVVAAFPLLGLAWLATQLPAIGAGALLYPTRRANIAATPTACGDRTFNGDGVTLRGWQCRTSAERRGTVVCLHGIADNRDSSTGAIARLVPLGFDVVAYDARAHGSSSGDRTTYGFMRSVTCSACSINCARTA